MKLSQKSLLYKVLKTIEENHLIIPGEKIIVAVSGGPDSVCLFHALWQLKEKLKINLAICHYNHRLRGGDSYNDFEFVKKFAKKYNVEFIEGEALADNLFKSEDEAREARYAFFKKIFQKGGGEKIALGHNLNDQVETFFLRLLRGTGLSGLKSIPYSREKFIRPLLSISRNEILKYLKEENLAFCVDQTNYEPKYIRNYFRHGIFPLLYKINPNLDETISGTISIIQSEDLLLSQLTKSAYNRILLSESKEEIVLSRRKWLLIPAPLRMRIIREAILRINSLLDITVKQMQEVVKLIEKGEGKKKKILPHSLRVTLISDKIVISQEH